MSSDHREVSYASKVKFADSIVDTNILNSIKMSRSGQRFSHPDDQTLDRNQYQPHAAYSLIGQIQRYTALIQRDSRNISRILTHTEDDLLQKELELQQAKERIQQLEKDLDNCRAQVFESIPAFEVSDTSILEGLTTLRESLSNWVEGLPEISQFQSTWELATRDFNVTSHISATPGIFPQGFSASQTEILEQWLFLELLLGLFETVLVGASPSDSDAIETLCDGIHRLEPKKGK